MVMPSKIFKVLSPSNLDEVASILSNLRYQERGLFLRTEGVTRFKGGIRGKLEVAKQEMSPILISFYMVAPPGKEDLFSILICERKLADRVADIFSNSGLVMKEMDLPMGSVRKLYEKGNVLLLLISVEGKDVKKVLLYGDSVIKTEIYLRYLRTGKELYVVYKDENNQVIGITSKGVVIFFTYIDEESLMRYIVDKLLPLC